MCHKNNIALISLHYIISSFDCLKMGLHRFFRPLFNRKRKEFRSLTLVFQINFTEVHFKSLIFFFEVYFQKNISHQTAGKNQPRVKHKRYGWKDEEYNNNIEWVLTKVKCPVRDQSTFF